MYSLSMCIEEAGKLIQELAESAHMVIRTKDKKPAITKKNVKRNILHVEKNEESKCFFCKRRET